MEYFIITDGEERGPYTVTQLRGMWDRGELNLNTEFRPTHETGWGTLRDIRDELEPTGDKPPAQPHQPLGAFEGCLIIVAGVIIVLLIIAAISQ